MVPGNTGKGVGRWSREGRQSIKGMLSSEFTIVGEWRLVPLRTPEGGAEHEHQSNLRVGSKRAGVFTHTHSMQSQVEG